MSQFKHHIDSDFANITEVHLSHASGAKGTCSINTFSCRVYDIFVYPQRNGFGRQLLNKSEDILKEHGCKEVSLYSLPHAQGFYQKCGYTKDPEVAFSPSIVKFKKQL
jgi:GNAT superfamily N-acetyltransferase